LNFASQRRAQANSIPKIANPSGITKIEGPGVTTITTPMSSTVSPITRIKSRRIVRHVDSKAAVVTECWATGFGWLGSSVGEGIAHNLSIKTAACC
jgi:hypothetical protein